MRKIFFLIMLVGSCRQALASQIVNPATADSLTFSTITFANSGTITGPASNTLAINTTFPGAGRNRLINGEMLFDQRYEGVSTTVYNNGGSGAYYLDNVKAFSGQTKGVFSIQQKTSSPPTGFTNYFEIVAVTTTSAIAAADFYALELVTEGIYTRDFLYGTANARTATFSFWARSSVTGNFGASIENQSGSVSYTFVYNIPVANTWTYESVTFAGETGSNWEHHAGALGLIIGFDIGSGSDHQTASLGIWQAGDLFATSSSVKLIQNASATLDITGTQLELGPVATAYEYRPYEEQLRQCQRYYEKSYTLGTKPGSSTTGATGIQAAAAQLVGSNLSETGAIRYMVDKATTTVVTLYTADGTNSGQWTWFSSSGVGTKRVTTVNDSNLHSFDVYQTASTDLWTDGQWTSECFLTSPL